MSTKLNEKEPTQAEQLLQELQGREAPASCHYSHYDKTGRYALNGYLSLVDENLGLPAQNQ
jgi:hypothetical protein